MLSGGTPFNQTLLLGFNKNKKGRKAAALRPNPHFYFASQEGDNEGSHSGRLLFMLVGSLREHSQEKTFTILF